MTLKFFILLVFTFIFITGGCGVIYRTGLVPIPNQPITGPIEIGSEWLEVVPPQPIKPWGIANLIKVQYLKYKQPTAKDLNSYSKDGTILYLDDGRQTKIEAIVYDDKGEGHEFSISGTDGVGKGFELRPKWTTEIVDGKPQEVVHLLPLDRTYTKLRIRSEIPLKCDNIEWMSYVTY